MERTLTNFGKAYVAMCMLVVVSLSISQGHTFETWLGEVSTNVNLRKAPGLDQEIIVVLEEATIFEVLNKRDDWYQVVTLWQTPEQRGWVFGKHVGKTSKKVTSSENSLGTEQEEEKRELSSPLVTL